MFVGTPDGDVTAYLASLERIGALDAALLAPGHGPAVVADPATRIGAVAAHRREREAQIVAALAGAAADGSGADALGATGPGGPGQGVAGMGVAELRERIYPGLDAALAQLRSTTAASDAFFITDRMPLSRPPVVVYIWLLPIT